MEDILLARSRLFSCLFISLQQRRQQCIYLMYFFQIQIFCVRFGLANSIRSSRSCSESLWSLDITRHFSKFLHQEEQKHILKPFKNLWKNIYIYRNGVRICCLYLLNLWKALRGVFDHSENSFWVCLGVKGHRRWISSGSIVEQNSDPNVVTKN